MPIDTDAFEDYKNDAEDMQEFAERVQQYINHPEQYLHDHPGKAFTAEEIADAIGAMAETAEHPNVPSGEEAKGTVKGKIERHDHLLYDADDVEQQYIADKDAVFYRSTRQQEPDD